MSDDWNCWNCWVSIGVGGVVVSASCKGSITTRRMLKVCVVYASSFSHKAVQSIG